ncbi:hypothetical protein SESBI_21714 [Sesbania bispinosa]|nr:hypothetical protein SESBI_21714 [Sesbania bispinosa]
MQSWLSQGLTVVPSTVAVSSLSPSNGCLSITDLKPCVRCFSSHSLSDDGVVPHQQELVVCLTVVRKLIVFSGFTGTSCSAVRKRNELVVERGRRPDREGTEQAIANTIPLLSRPPSFYTSPSLAEHAGEKERSPEKGAVS